MSYKKAKTKKKYYFECVECGTTQVRSRNIEPKSCDRCKIIAKNIELEKRQIEIDNKISQFKKENNFSESKCCQNCEYSEMLYYDEDYKCLKIGYTKLGDEIILYTEGNNCCDAFKTR